MNTTHSIQTRGLNLWYGDFHALRDVAINVRPQLITSLIGPSGCGKTTLLRCFNRINERYGNVTTTGEVTVLGKNIYNEDVSLSELRKSVGMVFQRPNPLPISIYKNVLFGISTHTRRGAFTRQQRDEMVESALREDSDAGLRNAAMEIYVRLGTAAAEPLVALLRDSDEEVRLFSAVMLGSLKDARAAPALIHSLSDSHVNVRHAAAASLGQLGAPEAVPRLIDALRSEPWLQYPAIHALGEIGDPSAAPALLDLLDDEFTAEAG